MADGNSNNFLATEVSSGNNLRQIENCWIDIPGLDISAYQNNSDSKSRVLLFALPEIQDGKSVNYSDQTIQGRASPLKTYAHSSNRTISLVIHLYVTKKSDVMKNLLIIRGISALAHPEYNQTYLPPRVARIKCGKLLSEDPKGVPVVLKDYSTNYETNIQWFYSEEAGYMPLHVSINTSWDVVYNWLNLPGHDDVLKGKY